VPVTVTQLSTLPGSTVTETAPPVTVSVPGLTETVTATITAVQTVRVETEVPVTQTIRVIVSVPGTGTAPVTSTQVIAPPPQSFGENTITEQVFVPAGVPPAGGGELPNTGAGAWTVPTAMAALGALCLGGVITFAARRKKPKHV